MLFGPTAFLGSVCSSRFFTSCVVSMRHSREAFVEDGISGGWCQGSGMDIFDKKWDPNCSTLSFLHAPTDPSGEWRNSVSGREVLFLLQHFSQTGRST